MLKRKSNKEDEDGEQILQVMHSPPSDDAWLSHGLDLENRIIDLTGTVTENMSSFVLRAMIKLNNINNDPITIYVSSMGGSLLDGMSIYDTIRASPSPVVAYGMGKILSMGIIILVAADERYAGKHTRFMMHQASHATEGKIQDTKNDVKEAEIQEDITSRILVSRSKLKMKQLEKLLDKPDHWFGIDAAAKYGILTTRPKPRKKKKKGAKR